MIDLLLDSTGDIAIPLQRGESSLQHQTLLLQTAKGDWKEQPTVGVGTIGFLKDENESGLLNEIRIEFEKDGMQVRALQFDNNNISVDANY